MKPMFTLHFRDTERDRRDLWAMVADGWRHRAYILKTLNLGKLGEGEGGLLTIEVSIYKKSAAR